MGRRRKEEEENGEGPGNKERNQKTGREKGRIAGKKNWDDEGQRLAPVSGRMRKQKYKEVSNRNRVSTNTTSGRKRCILSVKTEGGAEQARETLQ